MLQSILSTLAPAPIGPYSQAVCAGGFLWASGQIPLDPVTGSLVGDTTAEQAEQVFRNLGAVLAQAGVGPEAVVKTTVFLVDLADFAAVNEVYSRFFAQNSVYPARSTIQVAALPKAARIEIEAVAQLLPQ